MNTHGIYKVLFILGSALTVFSQVGTAQENLTNKITIDRIIVPEARAATRININPAILPPNLSGKRLNFAEFTDPSDITKSLLFTEPYSWSDSLLVTPWRGYAKIGYFPLFNLNASAGYRIVDNKTTTLDAWLQYNGKSYKANWTEKIDGLAPDEDYRLSTISLGANLAVRPDSLSAFTFDVSYGYTDAMRPTLDSDFSTGFNNLMLDFGWTSKWKALDYYAGAAVDLCGFTKSAPLSIDDDPVAKAAKETEFTLQLGVASEFGASSNIGLDVEAHFLNYKNANSLPLSESGIPTGYMEAGGKLNRGLGSVTPYYHYRADNAAIKLGARIDLSHKSGKAFHIAPDVLLEYTAARVVAFYGRLGGGEHLNTLASLMNYSPYILPNLVYSNSHIPFTAEAGVNIGNINGFAFGLFGAFARANDWLMPVTLPSGPAFIPIDMRGWRAGARISYTYRSLVSARASFEIAPKGYDEGWYEWRDRARTVSTFNVEGRILPTLTAEAGVQLRSSREGMYCPGGAIAMTDLENVVLVSLGGRYEISAPVSVFLRMENLLNHHYYEPGGIAAQGIHGLAGVNIKF